jgi:hypothetical protein
VLLEPLGGEGVERFAAAIEIFEGSAPLEQALVGLEVQRVLWRVELLGELALGERVRPTEFEDVVDASRVAPLARSDAGTGEVRRLASPPPVVQSRSPSVWRTVGRGCRRGAGPERVVRRAAG